jgi:hypothetical protein
MTSSWLMPVQGDMTVHDGAVDDDVALALPVLHGADEAQAGTRPVRRRRENVKYSAEEYDLSIVRQRYAPAVRKRSRRQIRGAL